MGASPSTSRTGTPSPPQGIPITAPSSTLPPIGGFSHTTRSNQTPPPLSNTAFPPLNISQRGDVDIGSGDEHVYNPLTPRGGGSSGGRLSVSPPVIVDGGHDPSKWGALRDRVVERRERHNQLHPQKSSVSSSEPSRTRNPSTRSEGRSFNASNNNVPHSISNGIQELEWSMTFGPTEECYNRMDAEGSILVAVPPALDGLTLVQQQERLAMGLKGLPKPGGRLRGSMFGKSPANKRPSLGVHDAFKPLNIPEVQLAYRRLVRGVTGRGQRDSSRVTISSGVISSDSQHRHQQHQYHPSAFTRSSSTAGLENPLSTLPSTTNNTALIAAMDAQQHHRRISAAEQQARRSRRRSSCDNPLVEIRPRSLSISSISSTSSSPSSSSSLSTSVSSVDTLDSLPEEKEVPQSKIGASDLLQQLKGHHHDGSGSGGSNSWVAASAGEGGLDPQSTHMVGGEFTSDDALNNKDTIDFFANVANDSVDCNSNVAPPNIGESMQHGASSRASFTQNTNTPAPTRFPVVSILDDGLPPRPPPSDNQPRSINENSSDHHLRACSHHASFGSSCSMQTSMGGATPTTAHRGGMKHSVSRTNSFPSGALSNSSYLNKTGNAGNLTQPDPHHHHRGSNSSDSAGGRGGCSSARTSSISTTATISAQQQCNNSNGFESLMVVWPDSHTANGDDNNTSAHIDDEPLLIHVGLSNNIKEVSPPPPLFRPTPPASRRPAECSPPRFDNNNNNTPPPLF